MAQQTIEQAFDQAARHLQAGRLSEAEGVYRAILARQPANADALHFLGLVFLQSGNLAASVDLIRQAIAQRPGYADAHANLGVALSRQGRFDEAIVSYQQAIDIAPNNPNAHNNLGVALWTKGRLQEAISSYQRAIALKPEYPEAHYNLGNAALTSGNVDEAIGAYGRAIALNPNHAKAHTNLGCALLSANKTDEAITELNKAIAVDANNADAYSALGNACKNQGRLDDAMAHYRKALQLRPDYVIAHNNLVYAAYFHPDYTPPRILEEARQWARQQTRSLPRTMHHKNNRDPNRRLRVGYISPDLFEHPVGRFLLPLLANHNPGEIEVVCYYTGAKKPDIITQRLRQASHVWHDAALWSDGELAGQILRDQIDILLDLSLHMSASRLLVFARKPAPVQVSYLGYCGTTGLPEMGYRFSDSYLDPPSAGDSDYSEKTIRLPNCYWCYAPIDDSPEVGSLPARATGAITFGSFNNFCKITAPTIACWIAIMQALPRARLVLHAHPGEHRRQISQTFAAAGVDPSRLRFTGHVPAREYLNQYTEVDIALDPFPYGGGTTTCDALWMGVPVITLAADRAVGRGGVTLLNNVGLTEWIAQTPAEYLAIAQKWANDLDALAALRQDMRQMMLASPLMDAKRFASDVEAAYRNMWHEWVSREER